jgi:hypothetical protein
MTLVIAAVLVIGGLGAAALFALGVPALLGLMAYDAASHRKEPVVRTISEEDQAWLRSKESAEGRISLERGIARAFVILGGAFWGIAVFAGLYSYRQSGMVWSLLGAFVPFVATLATLILGWYYERVTAALLTLASVGVIVWGVAYGFEAGVWMLVTIALIGPMLTAAVLFWMARREQKALEVMVASRAELIPATIASK